MLPKSLGTGDRFQHMPCPVRVVGADDDYAKTMSVAFHPYPFRIIDVQIDAECRGKFRWRV